MAAGACCGIIMTIFSKNVLLTLYRTQSSMARRLCGAVLNVHGQCVDLFTCVHVVRGN